MLEFSTKRNEMADASEHMARTRRGAGSGWLKVYEDIQVAIISGKLGPGERLIEDEIISQTNSTRHAVRRAFDALERAGLVTKTPNKSVQVRRYTRREIMELYDIRECLEVYSALRFMQPAESDLISELTSLAVEHRTASDQGDWMNYFRANNAFHECMYKHSGNQTLAQAIKQFATATQPIRTRGFPNKELRDAAIREHFEMIEAISRGDTKRLAKIVKLHICRPRDHYLSSINCFIDDE